MSIENRELIATEDAILDNDDRITSEDKIWRAWYVIIFLDPLSDTTITYDLRIIGDFLCNVCLPLSYSVLFSRFLCRSYASVTISQIGSSEYRQSIAGLR